jgi:very-short-patch-repair endonuclease
MNPGQRPSGCFIDCCERLASQDGSRNDPVVLAGSTFYIDVVFRSRKLAIEIDGREHHIGVEVFETQNPTRDAGLQQRYA